MEEKPQEGAATTLCLPCHSHRHHKKATWYWRKMSEVQCNVKRKKLTVCKNGEEHPKAAETARLIGPHPHYSHTVVQHDVISYCTTKLGLQETTHHFFFFLSYIVWCEVSLEPCSVEQLLQNNSNTIRMYEIERLTLLCSRRRETLGTIMQQNLQ